MINVNNVIPNIRELPVSLKLDSTAKYQPPIRNSGYIIDPEKFESEIKDADLNLKEVKALLLMMIKSKDEFLSHSIQTSSGSVVNSLA